MTLFTRLFAMTAAPSLLRLHGETAIYYPRGVTANARQIPLAIVDRTPFTLAGETTTTTVIELSVKVPNDAATGITTAELDAGSDEIAIRIRPDDAALTRVRIIGQPEQSGGLNRFKVR